VTVALLTLTEAADRLGVAPRDVVLLIAAGRLHVAGPATVPPGSRLAWIDAAQVDALAAWWASGLTVEPPPTPAVARVIQLRRYLLPPRPGLRRPHRRTARRRTPRRIAA